jgi:hypothetical protein
MAGRGAAPGMNNSRAKAPATRGDGGAQTNFGVAHNNFNGYNQGFNPGFEPGFNPGYSGHGGGRFGGSRGRRVYRGGYGGGRGRRGRGYGDQGYYDYGYGNEGYDGGLNGGHVWHGGEGAAATRIGHSHQASAQQGQHKEVTVEGLATAKTAPASTDLAAGSSGTGVGAMQESDKMHIDGEIVTQGAIKGSGKNKPPYCFRCLTKGHVMTECTTTLCCVVCDGDDHVTKACPLLKGVKPTAIPCGFVVEGLGFYYIPYTEKQKTKTESRDAMVTISEGSLTAEQVTIELERLLPGIKWNWVVEDIGDKSFATTFPSEAELQRMVLWGPVVARCANAKMEIKEKKDTEIWKYEIPKV